MNTLRVVIYREGDGFVAQCLNVEVASEGATKEEARENLREALEVYSEEPSVDAELVAVGGGMSRRLTPKSG